MGRISTTLEKLSQAGRKAVIPYIIAGDPAPGVTVDVMHGLVSAGADIVELGVPFSDPMAEGPVIQLGHERALAHNISLLNVLEMVTEFRKVDNNTPVVLMGYANPIVAMGYETFANKAGDAGVDGVLTVDLPPEESAALSERLEPRDIDSIFLIAPTTDENRVAKIVEKASGYIYYVSLKGVTGAGHLNTQEVTEKLAEIKQKTNLPVCVGFGIKDRASAAAIAAVADGVVVGSMLVDGMANAASDIAESDLGEKMVATAKTLLAPIVEGASGA